MSATGTDIPRCDRCGQMLVRFDTDGHGRLVEEPVPCKCPPVRPLLSMPNRVKLRDVALEFSRDVTVEEWEQVGRSLLYVNRAWQWWVGDWLNYGKPRYGERYKRAVDAAETSTLSVGSVRVAQWVSERIPPDERVPELSWSHHKVVASLDVDERNRLLDEAQKRQWSSKRLAVAAASRGSVDKKPKKRSPIEETSEELADAYEGAAGLEILLEEIRQLLGVQTNDEITGAIRDLMGQREAA